MLTTRTTTVATAGTAVQLFDTANTHADDIKIRALATNTGVVYVGLFDVSSTKGFALVKGEEIIFENHKDITVYYVDADTNGDKITWAADVNVIAVAP